MPEITLQTDDHPGVCVTVRPDGTAQPQACAGTPDQLFRAPGPDGGVLRYGALCMSVLDLGERPELHAVPCGSGGDHYWIVDHKGRLANNVGRCLVLTDADLYGTPCDTTLQTWRFVLAAP